ncbi:MAG: purine-nucleoside phosphorylase [Planctomycetales bacterium]|nr:purine-nucleoside phosphorylase [Planctomycetales bacterium]
MPDLTQQIENSAAAIEKLWPRRPRIGIILGTGLGRLVEEIHVEQTIPYEAIPHFPRSTALGHKGQLACGQLAGLSVVTMEGRFHAYEGYSFAETTFPVRVMHRLGINLLIVSNASGGLNPRFRSGEIMVIEDHINLMSDNPLVGIQHEQVGPRYPDMSEPYDLALIDRTLQIARREDFVVHRGVYVALTGPNYETRAEYRFLRGIGGDVVGMSTVPEVIVAAHIGLRVLALSTITNICLPDFLEPTKAEDVVEAAEMAEANMRKIVAGILQFESARLRTGLAR